MQAPKSVLVLLLEKNSYFFPAVRAERIVADGVFRDRLIETSPVFKAVNRWFPSLKRLFYRRSWVSALGQFSKIVVFDVAYKADKSLLSYLHRKAPHAKIFLYYWNMVKDEAAFLREKQLAEACGAAVFHYDRGDCARYGLQFNSIMYDEHIALPDLPPLYDCFFLGFSKDREPALKAFHACLSGAGLRGKYVLVTGGGGEAAFEYRRRRVAYPEYLAMLSRSRAILDIAQQGQDGLSLRVMEAIFFNKKLITTNRAVKSYAFYSPADILVYEEGKTTGREIAAFFDAPFVLYAEEVRTYYSIGAWAERFV